MSLCIKNSIHQHLLTICYLKKLDDLAFKVIEEITNHYTNSKITISNLADIIELNERTLRKKCIELFRKTPTEVLAEIRILHAVNLLNQNFKVSDVWYRVGFSSHSYFSAAFKQYKGVTPKKYSQTIST